MAKKLPFYIRKVSGERVLFDVDKLIRSLEKSKIPKETISEIIQKIKKEDISSTKQIYEFVLKELDKVDPVFAARYNLKNALLELGPTGYPFEDYVAKIFNAEGYRTYVGVMIVGKCISHQIDILLSKNQHEEMVECKFHNKQHYVANIQVPLYIWGRYSDIEEGTNFNQYKLNRIWIVTNTRFSLQCREYAQCMGIKLLDWSYPHKNNLPKLIDKYNLFPITSLTIISDTDKKGLIKKGIILCSDLIDNKIVLEDIGLHSQHVKQILNVVKEICTS